MKLSKTIQLEDNMLLSNFTTWRVGGPAEWLAEPKTIHDIKALISWAKVRELPCTIIGAGSNLLINDTGLKGLSLCLRKFQGSKINVKNGIVEANSGEPVPALAKKVAKMGLKGFEWAVGIPGTVGGATVMNAGAQGSCTAEHLESIMVISPKNGELFEIKKHQATISIFEANKKKKKTINVMFFFSNFFYARSIE